MTTALLVTVLSLSPAAATAPDTPSDQPALVAGTDVAAPKRLDFVAPEYPPEAVAQGLRGIVIVELLIGEDGSVADTDVVRSIPGLDEAALTAVRQWRYEVTKVDGRARRVRLTVPITFAIKLPQIDREGDVPELRQGALPHRPEGATGGGHVVMDAALDEQGRVVETLVIEGDAPWVDALLAAVYTWQFHTDPEPSDVLTLRIEGTFPSPDEQSAGAPDATLKVGRLRRASPEMAAAETDAQRAESAAEGAPGSSSPADATPEAPGEPAEATDSAVAPDTAAAATPPAPTNQGSDADATPATESETQAAQNAQPESVPPPADQTPPPRPATASGGEVAAAADAPAVEVITRDVPEPEAPAPPERPGFSSVRDVQLSIGVPDLTEGRRPVVPPIARMEKVSGRVQVRFAVDAAGGTTVQGVEGPALLAPAAEAAVSSWSFRRQTADRLRLVAVFAYEGDTAAASVAPEEAAPTE